MPLRIALTLVTGALGGAVFAWLHLPLAWMLGAMSLTAMAGILGAPLGTNRRLRIWTVVALGIVLGGSFRPDTFAHAAGWPLGLAALTLYILLLFALGYGLMIAFGRVDRATAFFAAMPGGINEMTRVAEEYRADIATVALTHAVRIYAVVFTVPLYLAYVEGHGVAATIRPAMAAHSGIVSAWAGGGAAGQALEYLVLIAGSLAGWRLAERIRLPGASFVGGLLVSGGLHLSGAVTVQIPVWGIALAQLVAGSMMGARFAGLSLHHLARVVILALISAAIMLGTAVLLAPVFTSLTGAPRLAMLLSLVPGGFTEMGLIALSLGLDAAVVAVFHVMRVVYVIMFAPVFFRWRHRTGNVPPEAG
ncbi:AbrB family transcriptional regulator [Tistrella mobilis]